MTTEGCQGCLEHPCVEVCPKKAVHMEGGRSQLMKLYVSNVESAWKPVRIMQSSNRNVRVQRHVE